LVPLQHVPVVDPVVLEGLPLEEVLEDALQVPVIRTVFETQRRTVGEEISKFRGIPSAKLVWVCCLLSL